MRSGSQVEQGSVGKAELATMSMILRNPARARALTIHASNGANLIDTRARHVIGIRAVCSPDSLI